ncbi:safener induced1 [Zea mays]|uniref:Safener induced1 n=1 Tax=Zea mays TaxID=4577 RepID=A0A1D6JYM8_MAIZE|nr:safener induced1 [Zea mays]
MPAAGVAFPTGQSPPTPSPISTTWPQPQGHQGGSVKETLPPALGSTSQPPPVFDGTTRLYICYFCPFAQRAWVTRNLKGLQDKMELVAIDLQDKPAWYKDKVYAQGTVPSLEHDSEVRGESLDLIRYIDSNFDGPALLPEDAAKRQFADELFASANAFTKALYSPLLSHAAVSDEVVAALDKLEADLSKFDDGPFFLGQFSLADVAYVTILERVQIYYSHLRNYDIAQGRSNLQEFIDEMNKIEAYAQTKNDPLFLLDLAKNHLKVRLPEDVTKQP